MEAFGQKCSFGFGISFLASCQNVEGEPKQTDPMPLRSDKHPNGLPTLQGSELEAVTLANEL